MENCPQVEQYIIKVMREKGIEIYENYNFAGVRLKREEFTENIKQEFVCFYNLLCTTVNFNRI